MKITKTYIKKPSEIKDRKNLYVYEFKDLLMQFKIDAEQFKRIFTKIINSEESSHSKALNKEEFVFLKNSIYELFYYGFTNTQISKLLLNQVSKKSISVWLKEMNNDIKRKPAQFYFILKLTDVESNSRYEKMSEKDIDLFIKKLFSTEISIHSFDGKDNISYIALKKLEDISRLKVKK